MARRQAEDGAARAVLREDVDARSAMPLADQVVDALRVHTADNADVVHQLSRWLGVGTADAEAFGQVLYAQERGTPLSPTVLGRRVGLSTGATAALLNRLEAADLVVRSREHRDRRVVTLRVPPDVRERAAVFFAPLSDRVDAMMRQHPPELLRQIVAVLDELHLAVSDVVREFDRAQAPAGPAARRR
ncbi:MarR family winged helix-turn-helix transcriptional regulator [Kineococcus aurantiacus]|uniref:DNA-binding MarR family transcriptional regulator n=1 Tax=Kineococcus aurantiacus TaxID=37633 RepID=A0A7Y9ARR5_9ACTN|nr:MarR family transcriptional regulator [Kineococcus aurantiacus]NYD20566.1 DNA-binding MarR family transcriptional regulator [Kineococcus aurantiacus]